MGVVSSNFKASVTFGGVVSSSFKSSTATLIGAVKKAERETEKLTNQQGKLAKKIEETAKAGKDTKKLQAQYDELSESIKQATKDEELFNKALKARKMWATPLSGVSKHTGLTAIGKGMRSRASELREKGLIPSALPLAGQATGLVGGLLAGGIGGALALNSQTVEDMAKARSAGVDIRTFKNWDMVAKQLDLTGDNITDMAGELANKVGELKSFGKQDALTDALHSIGLTGSDLEGKSNAEQMNLILNTLSKVTDQQVARSAADQIFGGEANKVITGLKLMGKSFNDAMQAVDKYNHMTNQAAEDAMAGHSAIQRAMFSIGTAGERVAGTLAKDLVPSIDKWADDFGLWFEHGGDKELTDGVRQFGASLNKLWSSEVEPTVKNLWRGLTVLSNFIGEHFADYETKYGRATNEVQVRAMAAEEASRREDEGTFTRDQSIAFVKSEVDRWESEQVNKELASHARPIEETPDQKLMRIMNPDTSSKPAKTTQLLPPPVVNVTVQSAPGESSMVTGKNVAAEVAKVFATGDSIMTPPNMGY